MWHSGLCSIGFDGALVWIPHWCINNTFLAAFSMIVRHVWSSLFSVKNHPIVIFKNRVNYHFPTAFQPPVIKRVSILWLKMFWHAHGSRMHKNLAVREIMEAPVRTVRVWLSLKRRLIMQHIIMHKNLAVCKTMEAMHTSYAKIGTLFQHISNYTQSEWSQKTRKYCCIVKMKVRTLTKIILFYSYFMCILMLSHLFLAYFLRSMSYFIAVLLYE